MAKQECVKRTGTITKLFGSMYEVEDDATGMKVMTTLKGKMKKHSIRITLGDKVEYEISSYDLTKGRITYCIKNHRVNPA